MQNLSYLHRFGAGQYFMEIFLAPASCVVRPRNLSEPISLAIQPAGLRLSLANLTQAHHHSAVGIKRPKSIPGKNTLAANLMARA